MCADFTKTLIVDCDLPSPTPPYYNNIKDAAAALSGIGGVIIVEKGVYTINSITSTVVVSSDTTIIGRGNAVIEVTGNAAPAFQNRNLNNNGNTNITISGFKIVVKDAAQATPYDQKVVNMKHVSFCTVENLTIYAEQGGAAQGLGVNANAIFINASNANLTANNTIRNCRITNFGKLYGQSYNYGNGILVYTDNNEGPSIFSDNRYIQKTIIKNNIVSGCKTCCYVAHADYNVIEGNIFYDSQQNANGHDGLLVECSDYTTIRGNQLTINDEHGLYLSGVRFSTVTGNVSCANTGAGIRIGTHAGVHTSNTAVMGNVCNANTGSADGINISNYVNHLAVKGNNCSINNNYGINSGYIVNPAEKNVYTGNIASGNASTAQISINDANSILADNLVDVP